MGDGVLAYFGWPRAHEDEAERAVRAGLGVVDGGRAAARRPAGEPLAARVGIATGLVVVGDLVGEGAAQEEAVVGETPNLAARLQALAEPGTRGDRRRARAGCSAACSSSRDLGPHALKGFAEPVRGLRGPRRAPRREPLRGPARGRLAAAGRPRAGAGAAARALASRPRTARARWCCSSGEAGIGKSRLVRALRERLAGEPHTPLRYQLLAPPHRHARSTR